LKRFILLSSIVFLQLLISENRNHTLLICLTPDSQPLEIQSARGPIAISDPSLQDSLLRYEAVSIERWLPSATPMDHDGDIYLNRIYRIIFSETARQEPEQIRSAITQLTSVMSAEYEPVRSPYYVPNDPQYNQQWFLPQIGANAAWDYWTLSGGDFPGDRNVLLASVDTGVDWDHVDLIDNIWQNLNEDADGDGHTLEYINGSWVFDPGDLNGVDDDNWDNISTTFVDDLIGWDLSGWSGADDNNPIPKQGVSNYSTWAHGTHVAGLLSAATDNSTGISSTAFNCSIMCVKVSREDQTGQPYITEGYSGILYAAQAGYAYAGISIQNNSWGGVGFNQYEQATINVAHDTYNSIILAAGGNGAETGGEIEQAHYPSSYENVISVAPLGSNDVWHHWATYHATIDIAAPGENIRSCVINNNYSNWDGSSMATPIVASTIGLMKSYYPERNQLQLETMILATADPGIYQINNEVYLQGKLGRGRVDAEMAIATPLFPIIEYAGEDVFPTYDQDGLINAGDVLELYAILFTDPEWGTATGVQGTLTTESPYVLIINGSAGFSDMPPGEAAINEVSAFEFELLPDIPEGQLSLLLTVTSNENAWVRYQSEFTIDIMVEASAQLAGDLNNDGSLDVLDIVTMVGIIIGDIAPSPFQQSIGDMNGDSLIDVLDVVMLVNQIVNN